MDKELTLAEISCREMLAAVTDGLKQIQTEHNNYQMIISFWQDFFFNSVFYPKLTEKYFDQEVEFLEQKFTKLNLPFSIFLQEKEHKKYNDQLLAKNFQYIAFKGMELDIKNFHPQKVSEECEISKVKSWDEHQQFAKVLITDVLHMSDSTRLGYEKNSFNHTKIDNFIMKDNNKVLSTASIYQDKDYAVLCNGGTLEKYRKQGLSSALYNYRIKYILENYPQVKKLAIQCSPMSENIAKKFGFKETGNINIYYKLAA